MVARIQLQVAGVKEQLRAFLYAVGIFLVELALFYPASLLDGEIMRQARSHFGPDITWIEWPLRIAAWSLIVILPLAAYIGWSYWIEGRRRAARLRDCLREARAPGQVRLAGRSEWHDFHPDMLVSLVVPDAIAALDRTHGLLRLKAVNHYQDAAIELRDIIGVEWQEGATRRPLGRQSLFRRFRPKYRTLTEHPQIRLEIASKGKGPVFEYVLVADRKSRATLNDLFKALERAARYSRGSNPATTMELLDALPLQGSRYRYAWIGEGRSSA